jgi:hypothetical protein
MYQNRPVGSELLRDGGDKKPRAPFDARGGFGLANFAAVAAYNTPVWVRKAWSISE